MHPVFFRLGPLEVRFYGLMYVVAILVGAFLIKREVRRKGMALSPEEVSNFVVWMVAGGVIVARLYYVAFNLGYYLSNPYEIPAVWHGGLAIHGGLIGGAISAWLYLRRHNIGYWRMADATAPAIILGQAFGRFGNFMNGDAHGVPTKLPWGIVFPEGSIAGSEFPGIPLHPVMLYEMLINISIFSFIWFFLREKGHKDGFIFAAYMALYSAGRAFVEGFRADSLMLGPMRAAQMVSISVIIISSAFIFSKRLYAQAKKKA
jgi:phosphatidylglycerol:prolipoprotein diacylglycerol transferase